MSEREIRRDAILDDADAVGREARGEREDGRIVERAVQRTDAVGAPNDTPDAVGSKDSPDAVGGDTDPADAVG